MKAFREAALWLAVFGSVAGVSTSLRAWEAAGPGATDALQGIVHQASLACATSTDPSLGSDATAVCAAGNASGEPALIGAGQVGLH